MALNPSVNVRAVAGLLVLGMLWGMTIPLTKIAVSSGHRPLGLIFWQLTFSTLLLLPGLLLLRRRRPPALQRPSLRPSHLLHYLVIALLGTLLPNSFSYLAAAELPAGVMAIAIASVPMFSLLIALTLRVESFAFGRVCGVMLGAAAVALLIGPETSLPEPGKAVFVVIALAAPACYGLEANYLALRTPAGLGPVTSLFGASLLGALLAAPLALSAGAWVDLRPPWAAAEWALLGSSVLHVLAYTGYLWLVGIAGPVFASQIGYVVTLAGVLLSALTLGESYSLWVWAALASMLAGIALVKPRRAETARYDSTATP